MKIKKNLNKKSKVKFPYRIYMDDGRIIPVPSQYKFQSAYIRTHGCSLAGFYMALRFLNTKKSMVWSKRYLDKHFGLHGHAKYSLRQISEAINAIAPGSPAVFKKSLSGEAIKKELTKGNMILFEERNPIHTAVLLSDGTKIKRFSNGGYRNVTIDQEIKKRCGDSYYGGCIVVKK